GGDCRRRGRGNRDGRCHDGYGVVGWRRHRQVAGGPLLTTGGVANEPAAALRSDGLVRIRVDVSYDGTDFAGWAAQPDQRTVQGVLEEALWRQPPGESLAARSVVAGRTDAGVHADAQVLHVDVVPIGAEAAGNRIPVDGQGIPDLIRMRR